MERIPDQQSPMAKHALDSSESEGEFTGNTLAPPPFQLMTAGETPPANDPPPRNDSPPQNDTGLPDDLKTGMEGQKEASDSRSTGLAGLKSTAWDGESHISLDCGGGTCELTLREVKDGRVEVAGNADTIRTDGVVQLYAGKAGIVAHVHADTGIGGGMTQKGFRNDTSVNTPPSLVSAIMMHPGYEKAKKEALALRAEGGKGKSKPRNETKDEKPSQSKPVSQLGSLDEAKTKEWKAGDLMSVSGTVYKWAKDHTAGDDLKWGAYKKVE